MANSICLTPINALCYPEKHNWNAFQPSIHDDNRVWFSVSKINQTLHPDNPSKSFYWLFKLLCRSANSKTYRTWTKIGFIRCSSFCLSSYPGGGFNVYASYACQLGYLPLYETKTRSNHGNFFGVINLGSRLNHRSTAFMVGSSNSSATSSFWSRNFLHRTMRNLSSEALRHEGFISQQFTKKQQPKKEHGNQENTKYHMISKTHFIWEISRDQTK